MLQLLLAKFAPYLIVGFVGILTLFGTFEYGVHSQKTKDAIEAAKLQEQIDILSNANNTTTVNTVTKYRDRYITVKAKEKAVIDSIPEVLKNESKDCHIGPSFIGLHNNAASSSPLSTAPKIVDGTTSTPGTDSEK